MSHALKKTLAAKAAHLFLEWPNCCVRARCLMHFAPSLRASCSSARRRRPTIRRPGNVSEDMTSNCSSGAANFAQDCAKAANVFFKGPVSETVKLKYGDDRDG